MISEKKISQMLDDKFARNLERDRNLQSRVPSLVLVYPLAQHQLNSGFIGQKWMLKLCCMALGEEHTLKGKEAVSEEETHPEYGWYLLDDLGKWSETIIRWAKSNEKILKVVSPRLGDFLEWVNDGSVTSFLKEAGESISNIEIPESSLPTGGSNYFPFSSSHIRLTGLTEIDYRHLEGQGLIFLQQVFDKYGQCGNLCPFVDNGKILWLCNSHFSVFQAKRDFAKMSRLAELLNKYLEQIEILTSKTRIVGDAQARELSDVFVELSIVRERERPSARTLTEYRAMMDAELRAQRLPFSDKEYDYSESGKSGKSTVKIGDLLKKGTRAIVAAAPGGGKSTLLRRLANQTLHQGERLPIFLEFKTIKQKDFEAAEGVFSELIFKLAVANRVCEPGDDCGELRNDFYERLRNGSVSLFLDGLDEISGESFFNVLRLAVKDFVQNPAYRQVSIIITSRPYALLDQYSRDEMQELELAPFNQNQVEQFVYCYYEDRQLAAKFLDELRRRHELRELGSVPALLGFLLVLFRERGAAPESRLEIYREIVQQLAGRWDEEKAARRNFRTTTVRRIEFLSHLAFVRLFSESEPEFSRKLVFTGQQILRESERYSALIGQPHLADELAEEVKMTPLLREVGTDTFAFAHLTVQEYLAAIKAAEREDCERLFCRAYFDSTLCEMEVLPMMLGIIGRQNNLYDALEKLPESIDYKKLRLQAKSLRYGQCPDPTLEKLLSKLVEMIIEYRAVEHGYFEIIAKSFSGASGTTGETIARRVCEILGNEHEVYRSYAVRVLSLIGSDSAIEFLKQALRDEDASVRIEAALEISRVDGELAVESLVCELEAGEDDVRKEVVNALWQIGTKNAIERLKVLTGDPNYFVRKTALKALSNLCEEDAIPILVEKLKDEESWVRLTVVAELGEIGGESVIDGLISATKDKLSVAEEAVKWLGKIGGQRAYDFLLKFIGESSRQLVGVAAEALGNIGNKECLPVLVKLFDHYNQVISEKGERRKRKIENGEKLRFILGDWIDNYIRVRIALALHRLGDARGIHILVDALKNDYHESKYAAKALAEIKGREVVPLLLETLEKIKNKDNYIDEVIVIGKILCDLKVEDLTVVIELIADFLDGKKHSNDSRRVNAINVLGHSSGQNAVDALKNALEHSDPMVQLAAVIALGNIATDNETSVEGLLMRSIAGVNVVTERAARTLARIDERILCEGLVLCLKSVYGSAREKAIKIIGYYTNNEQIAEVLSEIALNDKNQAVKITAREAVIQFQNKQKYF